jgi:hypothetical protein
LWDCARDLFRSRLDQIIHMKHGLVKLAQAIDWRSLEQRFGEVYTDKLGHSLVPTLPTWLMAGLTISRHIPNLSDEALCQRRVENRMPVLVRRVVRPAPTGARSIVADAMAPADGRRGCCRALRWPPEPRR